MRIKYIGGRSRYEVSINRRPHYFTPENKMILETKDQGLINYIFGLDNRHEFVVVEEEETAPDVVKEPKVDTLEVQPVPVHTKPIVTKKIVKHKKGGRR